VIGQRGAVPRLFEVPMSTDDMLERTLAVAAELTLRVESTPRTFDLDVIEDLASLDRLSTERASDLCPRTVEWISEMRKSGVL
jgi:glycosyltransferase A (GT-A) superfamily protein (DUF2064 family)